MALKDDERWRMRETFHRLFVDAKERELLDAAAAYGWSAMRLGSEALADATKEVLRRS